MIAFDALYLLLLVELACILGAGTVFFFRRAGKLRALYLGALKELSTVKQSLEDLKRQAPVSMPAPKQNAKPAPLPDARIEEMKKQLQQAEAALKDKTERMDQLQVKFSDLEKEYMILYHQQQKQQG